MSLHSKSIEPVPEETARIARIDVLPHRQHSRGWFTISRSCRRRSRADRGTFQRSRVLQTGTPGSVGVKASSG